LVGDPEEQGLAAPVPADTITVRMGMRAMAWARMLMAWVARNAVNKWWMILALTH
jgi:hypothetical protein